MLAIIFALFLSDPIDVEKPKSPTVHVEVKEINIEGIYLVEGTEETTDYVGVCSIKNLHGRVYFFSNQCGNAAVKGVGILDGDRFAVSWSDGKSHGVSLFKVENGKLSGHWSVGTFAHRETMKLLARWPE